MRCIATTAGAAASLSVAGDRQLFRPRASGARHPPPRSGGGGPRVARWRGRRTRRAARVFVMPKHVRLFACSLARFLLRRESSTTKTKCCARRPLHHGSLATRAPVVPLPRFAGAERGGALATRQRLSFIPGEVRIGETHLRLSPSPFAFLFLHKRRREAERRQTLVTTAASCDTARTLQGALVCRRSTTALA
jgi:hypothetical protein